MAPLPTALPLLTTAVLILTVGLFLRLIQILPGLNPRPVSRTVPRRATANMVIVLGSGGHTAEMLSMLRSLDPERYTQRTYIVSSGDDLSAQKAVEFEAQLMSKPVLEEASRTGSKPHKRRVSLDGEGFLEEIWGRFAIITVPRARRIHQPLYTTPFSCAHSLYACVVAMMPRTDSPSPDVILSNGPATGVMVILAVLIVRFLGLGGSGRHAGQLRTMYVESWARVKNLSLSGKILQWGLVDRFLVQWEGLEGGRREYRGALVE